MFAIAPDDRKRFAPIALPREKPVAQFVIRRAPAPGVFFQPGGYFLLGRFSRQAVEERRIDRGAVVDIADGFLNGFPRSLDDRNDSQPELLCEFQIARVVA